VLEILAEYFFRRKIEKGVEKRLLIRSLPNNTDMRKRLMIINRIITLDKTAAIRKKSNNIIGSSGWLSQKWDCFFRGGVI